MTGLRVRAAAVRLVPALLALALVGATVAAPAAPGPGASAAAGRGARFLVGRQAADGTLPGSTARPDQVAEAVIALAAGGQAGAPLQKALDALGAKGPAGASRGAYAGRIVMGLVAAGENPRAFRGTDYVARLRSYQQASGAFDTGIYSNALAMLGLLAAGEQVPSQSITFLRAQQCPDGGFAHEAGCVNTPDTDTTSMVLSVFVGAGLPADDAARRNARGWLQANQLPGGGFGLEPGDPVNANSTGLALSVLALLGEDPTKAPWKRDGGDPVTALLALEVEGGGFRYLASDPKPNDYATVQAVPGAVGVRYPPPVLVTRGAPGGDVSSSGSASGGASPSPAGATAGAGSATTATAARRVPAGTDAAAAGGVATPVAGATPSSTTTDGSGAGDPSDATADASAGDRTASSSATLPGTGERSSGSLVALAAVLVAATGGTAAKVMARRRRAADLPLNADLR